MFVPISFVVLGFMEYAEITDMMMMMRETPNYCLCLNHFENRCRVNEKKAELLTPCFLCLRAMGKGEGRGRAATPSRPTAPSRPDHPTRPTDPITRPDPTRKGRCRGCNPMQADAKGEKPMQADARGCKRKSKEVGGKGEGQGARGSLPSPKGAKGKSLGGLSVVSCCCVFLCAKALLRLWLGCSPLPL